MHYDTRRKIMLERVPKYTLRKLSVGLASVMIGSGILMSSPKVLAATNAGKSTNTNVQPGTSNQNEDKGNSENQSRTSVPDDTHSTGTDVQPGTSNQNEGKGNGESQSDASASSDTTDATTPTTPSDSTSMAIVNDKNKLAKNWIKLDNGKAQIYFTVKGNDQKPYVTSYMDKNVKSTLYTKRFDPNSLELHIEYQNGDKDAGSGVLLSWNEGDLQLDTSRIGTKGLVYTTNSGDEKDVPLSPGGGDYRSYNEWSKVGQDPSKFHLISLWQKVPANSTFTATLPFKYVGDGNVAKSTKVEFLYKPYSTTLTFDPFELHPAQIETPAKPTTDKDSVTTGIYNNPQITTSDWINMVHGKAIAYYTAKGKDGKTYVTGYVAANGKSQSIINVKQIDLNTLEYHLIYHNGDKEVGSGLWFNFADNKTIAIDTSRLGADGPQLKSQQGWSYKWAINTGADQGIYYNSWAEYLKAHNNVGDQASQISMTGVALKPDDTIEFKIPVKYTGQLSARTPSLTFSPHINDYGKGFTQNWADLYFTTVKKDLSEVKRVVLLPTEFMGVKTGESDWKLVKEISKDMPNGWDAFKISNFPTYKGSFNMDSLPTGDIPSVVYGTAQYFIDLRQIQQIFANHGYTVKYANNNGKAQEMPFYAYSTLPLAKRVDDDRPVSDDPSIWVIHVQAVPAIILNKDQHYVADPNAKPWDTTSMIDEIYAADDPGARKTRDELEKLPKTDVDISYEYQAPGVATAAAVDKVDLTKAGVYTVTYSHTYADGRVVKDSRKVYVDPVETETKQITRTINYVEEGNESHILHDPTIQIITFTRIKTIDIETGTTNYTDWTTKDGDSFAEVTSPTINGYTTTKDKVAAQAVTVDSENLVVNVTYKKNPVTEKETKQVTRTINYVEEGNESNVLHVPTIQTVTLTRNKKVNVETGEISYTDWTTGNFDEMTVPPISGYTAMQTKVEAQKVDGDSNDVVINVTYKKNPTDLVTEKETKQVTRTINYVEESNESNVLHVPTIQTVTLTRNKKVNVETGEISYTDWTTGNFDEMTVPPISGYTAMQTKVEAQKVDGDSNDVVIKVTYKKNPTGNNSNNDNNGGNNSNTELTDNNTDTSNPTDNNKSNKTKSTTTSKSNQSSKAKRTTKSGTISPKAVALASKSNQSSKAKRTTKSGTISPKAVALANTTAGLATSAKANMENGIAKNNSQNSQTLPQTGENESKVAFAVAGLLAAALGIFGIAINRKKEN